MLQNRVARRTPSFNDSLKALEADISNANTLADSVQRAHGGACLRMRLSHSILAPVVLFFLRCMGCVYSYSLLSYMGIFQISIYKDYIDGTSTITSHGRRASLKEFYAAIYPSLQLLESNLEREESCGRAKNKQTEGEEKTEELKKIADKEIDEENECGICLEVCPKMVLPSCSHALCINCYRDWMVRSQSCPFCRGCLKRVHSGDLWVLMGNGDAVDTITVEKDNVKRFHRYIDSLPLILPDNVLVVYNGYLF